MTHTDIKSQEY